LAGEVQQDPEQRRIVTVRGVRGALWDWLFVESARSRIPLGDLVNILILDWQSRTDDERLAAVARYRSD